MLESIFILSLIYGFCSMGICMLFRVCGFPDLTPDSSFITGASFGWLIFEISNSDIIALIGAGTISGLAGILTISLSMLGFSKLLSGILMMIALYSVNLRIMGQANISLLDSGSIFANMSLDISSLSGISVCIVFCIIITLYSSTNHFLLLRSLGENSQCLERLGKDIKKTQFWGGFLGNGIVGLSGYILCQYLGFIDINISFGLVISCLVAVIIGEHLLAPEKNWSLLLAPIIGMALYQFIVALALALGLRPSDLKVATVVIVLIIISSEKLFIRRRNPRLSKIIGNRTI